MKTTARNMYSANGNQVANQIVITTARGEYFQSYDSTIAFVSNGGKVTLDRRYWDYSRTTNKYRNSFLGCDSKTVKERVKNGVYKLRNLN